MWPLGRPARGRALSCFLTSVWRPGGGHTDLCQTFQVPLVFGTGNRRALAQVGWEDREESVGGSIWAETLNSERDCTHRNCVVYLCLLDQNSVWWQVSSILYPTGSAVTRLCTQGPREVPPCTVQTPGKSRPPPTGSLTALVDESPGLAGHTLEAAVVKTHDHALVPVQAVAGAHGLRHLEEATGVLQPSKEPNQSC